MTKSDFWFLNLVVEHYWPLFGLVDPNLELHVQGPGHGLSPEQIVAEFQRLFDRDWIAASWARADTGLVAVSAEEAMKNPLEYQEPWICFGLTARGGAAWESVARPDWRFYHSTLCGSDERGTIAGPARARVEQYLARWTYGWVDATKPARWTVLRPWQATYWKALPEGHQVTFSISSFNNNPRDYETVRHSEDWRRKCSKWQSDLRRRWFDSDRPLQLEADAL